MPTKNDLPTTYLPDKHWQLLIVDDDPMVSELTAFMLADFRFADKPVEILYANSAQQAENMLAQNPHIAVAMLDVVMETQHAGLDLVKTIRQQFDNHLIRLVIRTGQPGYAPEQSVCENYDIDDYVNKAELTAERFYSCLRTALRAYQTLMTLEQNRQSLQQALIAAQAGLRAKNAFLAKVHHELRTPLNAILGYCDLIRDDMQDNAYTHNNQELDKIKTAGQKLLAMISKLLNYTEKQANQNQQHPSHSRWRMTEL